MNEENPSFSLSKEVPEEAYLESTEACRRIYRESVANPEKFWGQLAEKVHWSKRWDRLLPEAFANGEHQWLVGAKISLCHNCAACRLKTWQKNEAGITSARLWLRIFVFATLAMLFWLLAAVFFAAPSSEGAGAKGIICGAAVFGSAAVVPNAREVLPIGP